MPALNIALALIKPFFSFVIISTYEINERQETSEAFAWMFIE